MCASVFGKCILDSLAENTDLKLGVAASDCTANDDTGQEEAGRHPNTVRDNGPDVPYKAENKQAPTCRIDSSWPFKTGYDRPNRGTFSIHEHGCHCAILPVRTIILNYNLLVGWISDSSRRIAVMEQKWEPEKACRRPKRKQEGFKKLFPGSINMLFAKEAQV